MLIETLADRDWRVRKAAVIELGEVHDSRAIESLSQALTDENLEVQEAAAFSLGSTRKAEAVEPLIQVLKDDEYAFRESIDDKIVCVSVNASWSATTERRFLRRARKLLKQFSQTRRNFCIGGS